ncbi:hypothetical protein BDW59DRAFT_158405 [Aspergillus cavernicola]|uniref:Uncharacterized protein n=1 Tax=Aspergillus cavernicola TaxID=176166 RepID=A0ABR4ISD2_9EURO
MDYEGFGARTGPKNRMDEQPSPGKSLQLPSMNYCRLPEWCGPPVTFAINANHSDMVKFNKGSLYCDIVLSKVSQILRSIDEAGDGINSNTRSADEPNLVLDGPDKSLTPVGFPDAAVSETEVHQELLQSNLSAKLDKFKRISELTGDEEKDFMSTTFGVVEDALRELQREQERSQNLMYMQRLEPFLVSMQQFGKIGTMVRAFSSASDIMAYVWGPMKYILLATRTHSEAFTSVLDAYQDIGEQIPKLNQHQSLFASSPYLRDVLVMIYVDILAFHAEVIRQLKRRQWKPLFMGWWREFTLDIDECKQRTARNRRLIENKASLTDFETICSNNLRSKRDLDDWKEKSMVQRKSMVMLWLSAFDCEAVQDEHRKRRSICEKPGRWLLENSRFKKWLSPDDFRTPLLWLSGIPGAGKTILASIVIDELPRSPDNTVLFFYCKHGEEQRSSFLSVCRSILAQILNQHPRLLSYFREKIDLNTVLTSRELAEEMIHTSLKDIQRTYIIIDGLDECGSEARKDITRLFRNVVEKLPVSAMGSTRCLFVSQDDGMAVANFVHMPSIKITNQNFADIADFARKCHDRIKSKFEKQDIGSDIQSVISAQAQGMFIFADLFAKYLEDQLSIEDLKEQLRPKNLPLKLDHVYKRILDRVHDSRGAHTMTRIKEILGWIVCARRPLQWREIQTAVCIDLDNQVIEDTRQMGDSPRGLFASLIEWHKDGTVDLVHGTAREYLIRTGSVKPRDAHFSLAIRSISYLAFPQLDLKRSNGDITSDLLSGIHSLYDYASACWAMHLQDGISELSGDSLTCLQKALERLIDSRWSRTHKPIPDIIRVRNSLSLLEGSEKYDKIVQAVGWAKKQSGQHGMGPSLDEALNLRLVTKKIRSVLENMPTTGADFETIKRLYGTNLFKCARVNCHYYHQGFRSAKQRDHHAAKHSRPFLCFIEGCPKEVFGYAAQNELERHLFNMHGISGFDDADSPAYPAPPKEKPSNPGKSDGKFRCDICEKTFTRKSSLKSHISRHNGEKKFKCSHCDTKLSGKYERDRHERTHDKNRKQYICAGHLESGKTWGCGESFSRSEYRKAHFKSEKGMKCIKPLLQEELQSGNDNGIVADGNLLANQTRDNADVLIDIKSLPSFPEVMRRCGLQYTVGQRSWATSPLEGQTKSDT